MKDTDLLRIQQVEELVRPLRKVADVQAPLGGWVRAVREALGMTNVQLARRLGRRAPQTIEDMQRNEVIGTIKLNTLRELAQAMGCRLVYAIVPEMPMEEMLRARATELATKALKSTSHTMRLEAQGIGSKEEQRALERMVSKYLAGNPKRLWD